MKKRNAIQPAIHFSILFLLLCSLWIQSGAVVASQDGTILQDLWMRVYMENQRVGYANFRTTEVVQGGESNYITEVEQHFKISRAGVELEFDTRQKITEDADGNVLAFRQVMEQGPLRQEMSGTVENDRLKLVSGRGPEAVEQVMAAPQGLGPWAVELRTREYGFEEGTAYSIDIFLMDAPSTAVTADVEVGGEEEIQLYGVKKQLHKVETGYSIMPGVTSVSWVDAGGRLWLSKMDMGIFELEMRKAPRYAALRPIDGAGVGMDVSVQPRGTLPQDPSGLQFLRLKLTPTDPDYSLPELPSGVFQSVELTDDGMIVEITRADVSAETSYELPYEGQTKSALLAETPWLEVNSPIIRDMARAAAGGRSDAYRAAVEIERFVFARIQDKGLDLGFATAAETARQLSGDCTEHAVLTAALARAAGMPSRAVVGLSYGGPMPGDTDPRFYYHMWTEVWVGEWLPLDAALGAHNVTNLAIARSGLSGHESIFDLTNATLALMGRVDIEVLDYR